MDEKKFKAMFAKNPEKYPSALEEKHPAVLRRIVNNWSSTAAAKNLFNDLVVDFRGNRQGFEPRVMQEIIFLSSLHAKWLENKRRTAPKDVLSHIGKRAALEFGSVAAPPERQAEFNKARISARTDKAEDIEGLLDIPNHSDSDGMTLLMHAASAGSERCMARLLESQANPHIKDSAGNTALHWACSTGKRRAAEMLLYFGADPNEENRMGITPMIMAATKPDTAFLEKLFDYGADPSHLDRSGNGPLHKAAMANHRANVAFLLSADANHMVSNKEGKSPRDVAGPEAIKAFEDHVRMMEAKSIKQ